MSTAMIWQIESTSLENTLELAEQVGRNMRGGEVVSLESDLGGGKTAFVRGLAKGMSSKDNVRSPSFTLAHEYSAGKITLHHFDFYRLNEAGIMRNQLSEVIADPKAVVVVEWAGIVDDVLPAKLLAINIRATSQTNRQLTFEYPDELSYLIPTNQTNQ